MKITRFAQSTVSVEYSGKTVLIDPGNCNFEPGRITRSDFKNISVLIVTHKHGDHYDFDAVKEIYAQCKCDILTVDEVAKAIQEAGIPAAALKIGQIVEMAGFKIEGIRADHVVRGEAVDAFGVVIEAGGRRVYHASDTVYFRDKPSNIDMAFVPINNRGVAMNFDDAAKFVRELSPRIAAPVHYDGPNDSHINPYDWAKLFENDTSPEIKVLAFGESVAL